MSKRTLLRRQLLKELLAVPGLLKVDLAGKWIEVKPGRFSPIYLNLKAVWSYPVVMDKIAKEIKELCTGFGCVVGIETGGSPFAALVARDLKMNLMLARKESKNVFGFLAGDFDYNRGRVIILDDVLGSGRSMENTIRQLKNTWKVDKEIKCLSIISYGLDKHIEKKYQIKVKSIFTVDELLGLIEKELQKKLVPLVAAYQKKLLKIVYAK